MKRSFRKIWFADLLCRSALLISQANLQCRLFGKSALQIWPIVITPISRCVWMCYLYMYVCVLSVFENVFSRSNVSSFNISETVRASVKMCAVTFMEVDIYHQTVPLLMLCFITLTFIFKVKSIFLLCISNKNCAMTVDVPGRLTVTRTAPAVVAFVPIVSTLPLAVYLRVTYCKNECCRVAKILKRITNIESNISGWMAQVSFFSSLILIFIFNVTLFAFYMIREHLVNDQR